MDFRGTAEEITVSYGYLPVCPTCGRLGYGYHEGTTGSRAHFFQPPRELPESSDRTLREQAKPVAYIKCPSCGEVLRFEKAGIRVNYAKAELI